jgi:hypothetical protein
MKGARKELIVAVVSNALKFFTVRAAAGVCSFVRLFVLLPSYPSNVKALEPEALPVRLDQRLAVGMVRACCCDCRL